MLSFDADVLSRVLPSTKLLQIANAIPPGERRSRDRFGLVALYAPQMNCLSLMVSPLLLLEANYAVEVEC